MAHRAVVQFLQMIAPFVVAGAVFPVERQMVDHRVAGGLVGVDEPQGDPCRILEGDGLVD